MKKKLLVLAIGLITGFISVFAFTNYTNDTAVGIALPESPALFRTSLAAPITSTASSLTLTANSVRGGGTLSGYNCFTIDEGSAQAEFVCGTASSTSVTGLTRGISPSDGVSEVTALKFSHRRGASVKITDFPIIQILRSQNNGDSTFENVLSYAASVVPSGANQLADVGYVLSVVNGGAISFDQMIVSGNAGETVATGTLVYFDATDQEWKKIDTDTESTFARVPVGLTQGAGVNGGVITTGVLLMGRDTTQTGMVAGDDYYATSTAGTISTTQSGLLVGRAEDSTTLYFNPQLDITQIDSTFSGDINFSGTVTFSASTTVNVYTASTTWTKPDNLSYIVVEVIGGGGGGAGSVGAVASGGGAGGYARELLTRNDLSGTTSVNVVVGGGGNGGASGNNNGSTGNTSKFSTFVQATGGSGGVNSGSGAIELGGSGGTGSLGDINFSGNSGGIGISDAAYEYSGYGGSSFYSGSAQSRETTQGSGNTGSSYGGGGGGALSTGGSYAGGDGADGIVIVTEYYN